MIEELKEETGGSSRQVAHAIGLNYRTLLRWQKRASTAEPVLARPGPKKRGPLPLTAVRAEIEALRHGRRRTRGVTALTARYSDVVSRRDLAELVAEVRDERNRQRRQVSKHVAWKEPNLAWALDATERERDGLGKKLVLHEVQDLCSRYRFDPLVATESKGEAVARHLDALFRKHGAPLFLKRDNGSSLNHEAIDAVLASHGVIPLNSPAHYPQYNGAIEHGIGEMKRALGDCLPRAKRWQPAELRPYINALHHVQNSQPRRSLHGHTPSEVYYHQARRKHTRRARLAIFEWIRLHSIDSVKQMEKIDQRSVDAAWRQAAETWLRCQGLITVSINQQVLPNLPLKYARD